MGDIVYTLLFKNNLRNILREFLEKREKGNHSSMRGCECSYTQHPQVDKYSAFHCQQRSIEIETSIFLEFF
jgi:hypothetical protein